MIRGQARDEDELDDRSTRSEICYSDLLNWFNQSAAPHVVVAFSGGVDSTLVLKAAIDALGRDRVTALTAESASLATSELEQARQLAETFDSHHVLLQTQELENPEYQANTGNRCFHCKTELYRKISEFISDKAGPAPMVVDGTNADDLHEIRPGAKAAALAGVRHPLAEVHATKSLVRTWSRELGLPTADKPAMACLASRLPVGVRVTSEKLSRVDQAEALLHRLGAAGARVRYHELSSNLTSNGVDQPLILARIEVLQSEDLQLLSSDAHRQNIAEIFRTLGFSYVTVDLEGYRLGGGSLTALPSQTNRKPAPQELPGELA